MKETSDLLQDIPDLNTYRSHLEILGKLDFSDFTPLEIKIKYDHHAKIIPSIFGFLNPVKFNKLRFYRVRTCVNTSTENIELIKTFSYPPSKICTENGRANLIGKSVFYCSDDLMTAVRESGISKDETGFLTIWKPKATRPIKISILLPNDLTHHNVWHEMAKEGFAYAIKHYGIKNPGIADQLLLLNKFVAEKFQSEAKPYYLTSMIADELLFGNLWTDSLLYPSNKSDSLFCNLAIHPNVVDNFLELEKVVRFTVTDIKNTIISYSVGRYAENLHANLTWKKASHISEVDFKTL